MPFNSYGFLFAFLPLTVAGFWLLARTVGRSGAQLWLILASIVFYALAGWPGLKVLAPSILLDYLIARGLLRLPPADARARNALLAVGIGANIGFLVCCKYRNFFLDIANGLPGAHFQLAPLVLPLGLSFLTFQKIAFLADVRSGSIERVSFRDYLWFTTFFPRSIAGPITRYNEMVPQLQSIPARAFTGHLSVGVALFSIGLFKKAFIADRLAQFVSPVFDPDPGSLWSSGTLTFLTAWLGALAYTLQLYFDFSGYSDMALGAARLVGIRLPMNFNSPYKARSIVDFWSRWHITLTRFLTAYLYTPLALAIARARMTRGKTLLQGSRSSASSMAMLIWAPTVTTMAISGLWHGAGWQFVAWGLLHGVYLSINQSWRLLRPRLWPLPPIHSRFMQASGTVLTFVAVLVALVFFRAQSVSAAVSVLNAMLGVNGLVPSDVRVLRQVGVEIPPSILGVFFPVTPWIWITCSLLWVTLLPNSLEILREDRPAVDYPEEELVAEEAVDAPSSDRSVPERGSTLHLGPVRVPLGYGAGIVAALLSLLGILLVNSGPAFIYWNF